MQLLNTVFLYVQIEQLLDVFSITAITNYHKLRHWQSSGVWLHIRARAWAFWEIIVCAFFNSL